MRNKLPTAVVSFFLLICLLLGPVSLGAESDSVDAVQNRIDAILAYELTANGAHSLQEWLDCALTQTAGSTAEWAVLSLRQYDAGLDFSTYADALEAFARQDTAAGAVTRQRYALALIACGRPDSAFVAQTNGDSIGEQGIMSWIFGLHLLNNVTAGTAYTASEVVTRLLSLRLSDGGWALRGEASDVDVTAMAVQALAPFYATDTAVRAAVDAALTLLLTRQLADGGFSGFGDENPESAAQVLVALSALGIDAQNDARFIKNGVTVCDAMLSFGLDDGSFCHVVGGGTNQTATVQALYALVALHRQAAGRGPVLLFDAHDLAAQSQPTAAEDETAGGAVSYKVWAIGGVAAAAAVVCVVFWLCKKRSGKNFLFVALVAAAAVCVIAFTDFQSTDTYYGGVSAKAEPVGSVTMTIRCDVLVGRAESPYIPADGVILPTTEFAIEAGDTAYDVLVEAARSCNIQMENKGSALGVAYIAGINYLYEFDYGDLSGWIYHVNGTAPSVGCGDYALSDGDVIEWLYTCALGDDLG